MCVYTRGAATVQLLLENFEYFFPPTVVALPEAPPRSPAASRRSTVTDPFRALTAADRSRASSRSSTRGSAMIASKLREMTTKASVLGLESCAEDSESEPSTSPRIREDVEDSESDEDVEEGFPCQPDPSLSTSS